MNASIIIRAFNEGEHIERLMLGIAAQAMQRRSFQRFRSVLCTVATDAPGTQ